MYCTNMCLLRCYLGRGNKNPISKSQAHIMARKAIQSRFTDGFALYKLYLFYFSLIRQLVKDPVEHGGKLIILRLLGGVLRGGEQLGWRARRLKAQNAR